MKNLLILLVSAELDIAVYRKYIESSTFRPLVLTKIPPIPLSQLPNSFWWGSNKKIEANTGGIYS